MEENGPEMEKLGSIDTSSLVIRLNKESFNTSKKIK
ncbi:Uncharacterised protein [Sphingobacterium daejeonense]|nr:Uncharacterised protein [Sphingobacterium daejeonense]